MRFGWFNKGKIWWDQCPHNPHFKHTVAGVKYMLSLPSMCNVTLLLSILHVKSSLQVLKNGSCSKIFAVFYEHPFYGVHTMYFSHSLNYFARKFFNVIKKNLLDSIWGMWWAISNSAAHNFYSFLKQIVQFSHFCVIQLFSQDATM